MWITKGNRMCSKDWFFFCVNIIINYYYYYCSAERGGKFSLIFLCSQVESAWKCFGSASVDSQASRAALRLSDLWLEMFDRNQKPELGPHDVLPPDEPSCRVRIVQSYVANHGRILKNENIQKKKNRNIFVTVAIQCHVVATEAGRIHIDLWAGPGGRGWAGRASQSNGRVTDRLVRKRRRQGVCYTVKIYRPKCLSFTTTVVELLLWCFLFNIYVTFRWEILRFCLLLFVVVFFFALFSFLFTVWKSLNREFALNMLY